MAGKECDTFDAAFFRPRDSAVFGRLEIGFESRLGILFVLIIDPIYLEDFWSRMWIAKIVSGVLTNFLAIFFFSEYILSVRLQDEVIFLRRKCKLQNIFFI